MIDAINTLMSYVRGVIGWVADQFYAVGMWLWQQIFAMIKAVGVVIWEQMNAWLPSFVLEYIQGAADPISRFNGDSLRQYINAIDWFVPVYSTLGIMGSALFAVATIRSLRWVKAFIPTMDS